MGVLFIRKSDPKRYGPLLAELQNNHTRGSDQYPQTLTRGYELLVNYRSPRPGGRIDRQDGGVSFLNNQDDEQSNRFSDRGGGRHGHGKGRGRGAGRGQGGRGQQHHSHENMHTQEDDEGEYEDEVISSEDVTSYLSINNIGQRTTMMNGQHNLPNSWLLLDSCSTDNLITNRALLHGIHTVDTSIRI